MSDPRPVTPDALRAASPDALRAVSPDALRAVSPDALRAVSPDTLDAFVVALLTGLGVAAGPARAVARNMVWSERVGRGNFGVQRLPVLVKRLEAGVLDGRAEPRFERLAAGAGALDAGNGFGQHAGEVAMRHAIALAREAGLGCVTVRASNWNGTGAYFVAEAADAGMIGLALSNAFPKVVAHGGRRAVLGTNPFAFGAPRPEGDHLLVDFATSALAGSTVRAFADKGLALPEGLAIAPDGAPVTDPALIGEAALLPFGGAKGFGLALMVEVLAGVLSGAGVASGVRSTYGDFARAADNGHCMIALDIARFMPLERFHARFAGLVDELRASGGAVLLPGEARWAAWRDGGGRIALPAATVAALEALAARAGVPSPFRA